MQVHTAGVVGCWVVLYETTMAASNSRVRKKKREFDLEFHKKKLASNSKITKREVTLGDFELQVRKIKTKKIRGFERSSQKPGGFPHHPS